MLRYRRIWQPLGGTYPVNTVAPAITGTIGQGNVLTCSTGSWTNLPTGYSYQWYDVPVGGGTPVAIGTNANTYTQAAGDVGYNIYCIVTASNVSGSRSAISNTVGPVTGTVQTLAMGLNLETLNYYDNTLINNDMRFGDNTRSRPSGNVIPAANMNASHQITSMPTGDTSLSFHCQPPEAASTTIDATFTGGNVVSSLTMVNANITAGPDYVAGTVSVVPTVNQPSSVGFVFQLTPSGGTMPQLLSVKPHGTSGQLAASASTNIGVLTTSAGPLRMMKVSGVENNEGVQLAINPANAFPAAKLTSANRNTPSSQDQLPNDGTSNSGMVNDGLPKETCIAIAQAAGRPLWLTLPWNADSTYYNAIGDLCAAAANASGLVTYFEQSNEIWNGTYWVYNQAACEAYAEQLVRMDGGSSTFTGSISGTTLTITSGTAAVGLIVAPGITYPTHITSGAGSTWTVDTSQTVTSRTIVANPGGAPERGIEKSIATMNLIKARYVAAGAPLSCFQPVLAIQNADAGNAALYLSYQNAYQAHKVLASAPYVTQQSVPTTDTTEQDFINAMYSDMDTVVDTHVANLVSAATARGMAVAFYEFGQSCFIQDTTTRHAVQWGSDMYGVMMNMFARTAAQAPGAPLCNFVYVSPEDTGTPYGSWGIMEYSGETPGSTTPKYNAQKDFVAGKRKLISLVGTFGTITVTAGASVGTALGYLKRRTPGSTITLQSNPGTAVAITDPTAQILQFTIATAAAFTSPGTINVTVRETDPRDSTGFLDTPIAISVGASLTGQAVTTDGGSTATLKASTTATSGTRQVIVSTSATPPTAAQIKLGQDSSGSAAAWWNGGVAISAPGVQTDTTSATLANTTQYYGYWLVTTGGVDSTVVSLDFKVNYVVNGNMASSSNWTLGGGNISGGFYNASGNAGLLYQHTGLPTGRNYTMTFAYTCTSGNSLRYQNSFTSNTNVVQTNALTVDGASHTFTATGSAAGSDIGIEASGAVFTGTITNVVVHLS